MANLNLIKSDINTHITTNGNQEITGAVLNAVLRDMVDALGDGFRIAGVASPSGSPASTDNRVCYIAVLAGTYTNYGGAVLNGETVHLLTYDSTWHDVDTGIASYEYLNAIFAKKDGYYASLTAGAAENLVGRGSVPASFLRRTTGGTADVGTGSAKIAKLMGKSIVWNQLLLHNQSSATVDGITYTNNGDGSWTLSQTATSLSMRATTTSASAPKLISGHIYLLRGCPAGGSFSDTYSLRNTTGSIYDEGNGKIFTASASESFLVYMAVRDGVTADNLVFRPMLIDLTLMFGAGKEPSTVAEFEALFPLDYYAENAGEVLPFAAQKLVTTGFNQWDEEWELGAIDNNGIAISYSSAIRSKYNDPIGCLPSTDYYFRAPVTARIFFYDGNDAFIGRTELFANRIFTTPAGCCFLRFGCSSSYGVTYNHDICINLSWSGYRNGEYEPYELHELMVDPANWEDANGDKIYPYGGMHGVGTARDFATPDNDGFIRKATKVYEKIDLGSLDWNAFEGVTGCFYASIIGKAIGQTNIINDRYVVTTELVTNMPDKSIRGHASNTNIYIRDTAYAESTAEQFEAAMSGVYLYYALATPVETELAEPVAASYYANDFGTEEWQPANDDEPYTAPCEMLIAYAMNAVDTLRRLPENYMGVDSFGNFCDALATSLGAALNKTITITPSYDAEDQEYDFAITIEDIEEG